MLGLVTKGALATLAGALLAGAAAAQSTLDIEVCNRSRDNAVVAVSYQPIGAGPNDWLTAGWFGVNSGKCTYLASTQNAYFYVYGEVYGNSSRFWGGRHALCVEYPGPFESWDDGDGYCERYQHVVNFQALHADSFGKYTWYIDP